MILTGRNFICKVKSRLIQHKNNILEEIFGSVKSNDNVTEDLSLSFLKVS